MAVVDGAFVDRVSVQARQMAVGRSALLVVAAVLFSIGWAAGLVATVIGKLLGGLWLALTWVAAAVREGWREARKLGVG